MENSNIQQKAQQSQPQYIAIPRAVPVESMINEIYDSLQEIKANLMQILKEMRDKNEKKQ